MFALFILKHVCSGRSVCVWDRTEENSGQQTVRHSADYGWLPAEGCVWTTLCCSIAPSPLSANIHLPSHTREDKLLQTIAGVIVPRSSPARPLVHFNARHCEEALNDVFRCSFVLSRHFPVSSATEHVLVLNVEKRIISCCEADASVHRLVCIRIEIKQPTLKSMTDETLIWRNCYRCYWHYY
jgi:hypothetical protein